MTTDGRPDVLELPEVLEVLEVLDPAAEPRGPGKTGVRMTAAADTTDRNRASSVPR